MKKRFRTVIALLLAAITICSLSAVAFAEDPGYTYTAGQTYQADENQVFVYTVQVSPAPSACATTCFPRALTASSLRWRAATAS